MNLISRQAVLDGIDKYIEKAQSTGTKDDFISFAELGVKALPSAFEGMTNGEVLQAVISQLEPIVLSNETGAIYFDWDWWNAPYQKGGKAE